MHSNKSTDKASSKYLRHLNRDMSSSSTFAFFSTDKYDADYCRFFSLQRQWTFLCISWTRLVCHKFCELKHVLLYCDHAGTCDRLSWADIPTTNGFICLCSRLYRQGSIVGEDPPTQGPLPKKTSFGLDTLPLMVRYRAGENVYPPVR